MKSQLNSQSCWACKKPLNEKGIELANGEIMHEACLLSNSQELDEIIDKYIANRLTDEEYKTALLQLALSCLPEKREYPVGPLSHEVGIRLNEAIAVNSAIDTIEQQIRAKFS